MKKTDSRECRNCHDYESMDYPSQGQRSMTNHIKGFDDGQTCIDCHKGIAHENVRDLLDEESNISGTE